MNKAPRAATIVAAPSRSGGSDKLRVATLSESAFTRLLGPLSGIMGRHARENYGLPSFHDNSNTDGNPANGLAATDFSQIAPHEVAPSGGNSTMPGGGTWVGGLGSSPFN